MSKVRPAPHGFPRHDVDLSTCPDAELVALQAEAKAFVERSKLLVAAARAEMERAGDLSRRIVAERRRRNVERMDAVPEDTRQRRGGLARAASMTPEERKANATRAANARWGKHG